MELGLLSLQSLLISLGLVILGLTHGEGLGPTKRPLPGQEERGTCRECCERGLPGQQGNPGYPGVQGPAGLPGNHGNNGNNGPPGVQGPKGDAGPRGMDGTIGSKGDQGPIGLPGKRGQAGDPGIPGAPGKPHGAVNSQPQGPRGPRGHAGPRGPKGESGDSGRNSHNLRRWSAFSFGSTNVITASTHDDRILEFNHEFVNIGDDFDTERSVFTCQINGTYYFVMHANKWSNSRNLYIKLMKNGEMVTAIYEDAGYDYYDGISNSLLLHLRRGDRVWLQLHSNNEVYGGLAKMTTFSGWLVRED
nr:collagen alpha-1(X) chain-like [Lytechinus pictus]